MNFSEYQVRDGKDNPIVRIDRSAAKGNYIIDYTLADGRLTIAVLVKY